MPSRENVVAVEAELVAEILGVEAPALVEAADLGIEVATVAGQVQQLRGGQLEVVAGHGLVERQRFVLVAEPRRRVRGGDALGAVAAAVVGGRPVVGQRTVLRLVGVELEDVAGADRHVGREVARQRLLGPAHGGPDQVDDLLAGLEPERRVVAQPLADRRPVGEPAGLLADRTPSARPARPACPARAGGSPRR